MKKIWRAILPYVKNKFLIVITVFAIWITFFSQYNLLDRRKLARNFSDLKAEKAYYIDQIKKDSTRLYELTTNNDNLEKFAREHYYMKKDNEDIFIVVEKD